ncbi:transmembrane 9 superfamily member 3-like [Chelonus insularis]|uniref:transmembrane 9 superfamily member 3-like n=1 Tax=Chelonus insularis TaxID=460826 RepID=UPI00158EC99A|nr:transmembrane 9 superfamily member 3-like [Chelonus insularis]
MNWIHHILSFLIFGFLHPVLSDEVNHVYQDGEEITLWVGPLRPYNNKQETYPYYSLPFCQNHKDTLGYHKTSLLDALQGINYVPSGLYIGFTTPTPKTDYCAIYVTEEDAKAFKHAIYNQYWYEMTLDKLPVSGTIGTIENEGNDFYLFTHKKFIIKHRGDQIIEVGLENDMRSKITPNTSIVFSYEVNWMFTGEDFECRYSKYLDSTLPIAKIHWMNLLYSVIKTVVALSLIYIINLRILRKRRSLSSSCPIDNTEDSSTNDQHDLLQPFQYPLIFSSLMGIGFQLMIGTILLFIYGTYIEILEEPGSLLSAAVFIYIFTCPINGFYGGGFYLRLGGQLWMPQLLFSTYLGPSLIWGVTMIISLAANYFQTTRVLSVEATVLWTLVCLLLPLFTAIGTVLAKHQEETFTKMNTVKLPMEIPTKKQWFLHPLILIPFSGVFSFGVILPTLSDICDSFWKHNTNASYNYICLSFMFLHMMVLCTGIVSCYLLFKGGRCSWQWTSFLGGTSIGQYTFIYSIYYYIAVSKMDGIFQIIFYFAYMALISVAIGVMCGAISSFAVLGFFERMNFPSNGRNRQKNILQYVSSEKSNNSIWLIPHLSLEKPVDDLEKNILDNIDLPQLHYFDNEISKDKAQFSI